MTKTKLPQPPSYIFTLSIVPPSGIISRSVWLLVTLNRTQNSFWVEAGNVGEIVLFGDIESALSHTYVPNAIVVVNRIDEIARIILDNIVIWFWLKKNGVDESKENISE